VLVMDPDREHKKVYVGSEDSLFLQRVRSSVDGQREIWNGSENVRMRRSKGDTWTAPCGSGALEFSEVDDALRKKILAHAGFKPAKWKRREFALARDDRGTYYYVDHLDEAHGGKGYRVFKGPRGRVELTKLIDIVEDTEGKIFATRTGNLRLLLNNRASSEALWIEGRKQRKLVYLPTEKNRKFIYEELGVYAGADLGAICGF
jgi:hypothetical protein